MAVSAVGKKIKERWERLEQREVMVARRGWLPRKHRFAFRKCDESQLGLIC